MVDVHHLEFLKIENSSVIESVSATLYKV